MNEQQKQNTINLLNKLISDARIYNDLMGLNGVKIEFEMNNEHIEFLENEESELNVGKTRGGGLIITDETKMVTIEIIKRVE